MTRDELLNQTPTDEQIETSLRRIGKGEVRRCIPVDPDDDDVVLSNAIESLRSALSAAREEAERWKGTAATIQTNLAETHAREKREEWRRGHTEGMEDAGKALDQMAADMAAAREEARSAEQRAGALADALEHERRQDVRDLTDRLEAAVQQADVWRSQLHDTAAALHLAKEEARRLTERAADLQRNWDEASSAATRLIHERDDLKARLDSVLREYRDAIDRADRSESSARRLREALEDIASDMCATEAVRYDSQKCTDFCVDPAGWCEVCRARAALGSSPVDTKGETT